MKPGGPCSLESPKPRGYPNQQVNPAATDPPQDEVAREALALLEFPQIRERLASFTSLSMGCEMALGLVPSSDRAVVAHRQQETLEARRFLENRGALDLSGAKDLRGSVQRATLVGTLTGAELREVHDTLKALRLARATLARRADLPLLSSLASNISDLRDLEEEVAHSVDVSGRVLDQASPALKELRQQAETTHTRLLDALQRTIRRLRRDNVLQEPLVTERHGRLVLMVKSEMKHRLSGIVHDVSDSGATAFVEPLSAVAMGNAWREAALAAQREEERVLRVLSGRVGIHSSDIFHSLELLARLDLAVAKGRYSQAMACVEPLLLEEAPFLRLVEARHPLLGLGAVPITIEVGGRWTALVITGPNAGGKTVALKTVGLLIVMAQAGLHVPARECCLSLFDQVYADIGDQQSIQRSLSSFSSHVHNLRQIMDKATSRSLVLIDELGTSTDPEEGAALAKAVLLYFAAKGVACIATTHHRDVAAFAQEQPRMMNASVELDPKTLEPTYRLTIGLPGRSYALTIAARLGLDPETVEQARSLLSAEHRQTTDLLRQLEEERYLAQQQRQKAQEELARTEVLRKELEQRLAAIEGEKDEMLVEARSRVQAMVDALGERLRQAERVLEQPAARPGIKAEQTNLAQVRRELRSPQWQPAGTSGADWVQGLQPGDWVFLRGVPQSVEVVTPPGDGETLEVLLGSMRARVPVYQLHRPGQAAPRTAGQGISLTRATTSPVGPDLDLRGLRVEEAEAQLETFLNNATLAGLSRVRIVHGAGTGALRSFVRERLKSHPLVKGSSQEEPGLADALLRRTEDTATVVELN